MAPRLVLACPGDCDGDQLVVVGEIVTGVRIALGTDALSACANLDRDESGRVTIDENLSAVGASLDGCPITPSPTPTATATPTATLTPTPTPSPTVNLPPELVCTEIYKAFANNRIEFPMPVHDPDGGSLRFRSSALPFGAELEESTGVLRWRPGVGDVGSYYVPYTVEDLADPPNVTTGQLVIQVVPLDACTLPVCEPALGCHGELIPLEQLCCIGEPPIRLGDPVVTCPGGRALHVGRNRVSGFGRLKNCDILRVRNFSQTGASMSLNFEASCIDTTRLVDIRVRVETATRLLFDETATLFLTPQSDGYARVFDLPFPVLGPGPFFEFEGADALVTVALTDGNGLVLEEQVRPVLTFDVPPDVADPAPIEPIITPDPCLTPTPTGLPKSTPTPTHTAAPTDTATIAVVPTDTVAPTPTDTATAAPTPTATEPAPAEGFSDQPSAFGAGAHRRAVREENRAES